MKVKAVEEYFNAPWIDKGFMDMGGGQSSSKMMENILHRIEELYAEHGERLVSHQVILHDKLSLAASLLYVVKQG